MGTKSIVFLTLITTIVVIALVSGNQETARKEKEQRNHRIYVRQALQTYHPNLLEAVVHIDERVTPENIVYFHKLVVYTGYECSTIFSARLAFLKHGLELACNGGRYRYEILDVGGNWVVTVE